MFDARRWGATARNSDEKRMRGRKMSGGDDKESVYILDLKSECINFKFGFVKLFVLLYVMYVMQLDVLDFNSLLM